MCCWACILVFCPANVIGEMIGTIPGRAASAHFNVTVQSVPGGSWEPVFVLESESRNASASPANQGYFDHLDGWTSSWINIMLGQGNSGGVRLRVSRINGANITSAVARPVRSGATVRNIAGHTVEVSVPAAARFTLSLDGGLEDTDTGPNYKGAAIHTFSAFVNP